MKWSESHMKLLYNSHLLLIMIVVLSGCVPASSTMVPMKAVTTLPSFTPIPPTPSSLPQPTQTITLTPPPTLLPEQAKETITTLLKEPVDCDAPCFWGIIPEQTTFSEVKNILNHLGLQIKRTMYKGKDFYGVSYDLDSGLSVLVTLTVQGMIVTDLRVDINPETQKTGVLREWSAYSPEALIQRYGTPSKVDFALEWGPRSFFAMDIYFETVELIVEYTGYEIISGTRTMPQVCPLTDQFSSVRIWMGKDPQNPPPDGVLLEEATSMTAEEFSELMKGSPDTSCFSLDGEMFP
jgi:hypothetical protein